MRAPFEYIEEPGKEGAAKGAGKLQVERRSRTACDLPLHSRRMRRPTGNTLLAGLCAAACSLSAVDGTRAFDAGAWEVAPGGQDCHRSFPAFLWAGSKAGGDVEEGYHHAAKDASEVATTVFAAATSAQQTEVVVVVLSQGSSFSTSGVSDAHAAGRNSESGDSSLHAKSASATFPYTYPSPSTLQLAVPLLASEAGVSVHELSVTELAGLSDGILTDGKLDVVMVTMPETSTIKETDDFMRSLTPVLEAKSDGRFLLLWTGDFHDPGCGRRSLSADARAHRRLQTETTSRTIKMTPDILAGLLTLFLFLFIMVTGLGCVGDIECPQSFSSEEPAKGREY